MLSLPQILSLTQISTAPTRLMPLLKTAWTLSFLVIAAIAVFDSKAIFPTLSFAASALFSTLPYILIAVFLLAYLKACGADRMIAAAFKGREHRMIVLASLFGGLAPFCSCEVIPFIAGLLALGAPLSAVMAFWLSSPLIDPPTFIITAAHLGWSFAIAKTIFAVLLGLLGGFIVKLMMAKNYFSNPLRKIGNTSSSCSVDSTPDTTSDTSSGTTPASLVHWQFWHAPSRRQLFYTEFLVNGHFLLRWISFAYILEAVIVTYIPAEWVAGLVGGEGALPIAIAALVGMPAYVNTYVAPPLVASLIEQGMSHGAAMAFIISGPVSSAPAAAAVWSLVKPHVFVTYLALGLLGAFTFGLLFQILF